MKGKRGDRLPHEPVVLWRNPRAKKTAGDKIGIARSFVSRDAAITGDGLELPRRTPKNNKVRDFTVSLQVLLVLLALSQGSIICCARLFQPSGWAATRDRPVCSRPLCSLALMLVRRLDG